MYNIFEGVDIVINTPTLNDWICVVRLALENGLRWSWRGARGASINKDCWKGENICVHISHNNLNYDFIGFYRESCGYRILTVDEFYINYSKWKILLKEFK